MAMDEKRKHPKDFIYRFRLDEEPGRALIEDAPAEMVRKQLEALLKVVVLTEGNRELKPDRFRFMNNPEKIFPIFDDADE
jgi:hypothetical protein